MSDDLKSRLSETGRMREVQFNDRWAQVGAHTGILELSAMLTPAQLKQYEIFQSYDDKFLQKLSPDISIARWRNEAVLFEEGSYIDLAFCIISGTVDVYISQQQQAAPAPIFDPLRTQTVSKRQDVSVAVPTPSPSVYETVFQTQVKKQSPTTSGAKPKITFLATMDFDLQYGGRETLTDGAIFGEIGALVGWPQSVTAKTTSECQVIQIRTPALQKMKRKSKALKERLDKTYRERALLSQLSVTPLFLPCEEKVLRELSERVELVSCQRDESICVEGESADALFLVRSGFVKLTKKLGTGDIVVSYLSKGMTLGEAELVIDGVDEWLYTATSVEHTELVRIAREDMNLVLDKYADLKRTLWASAVDRIKETGYAQKNLGHSEFINTALEQGLVEGNSILVIDLDVCTRCDDCVRGCAATHGGLPRFVREGEKYANLLITRACYHCRDPVCLIGCPTGSIRRAGIGDVVEIEDDLCIGCSACANKCPYDAITMHDTETVWPDNMVPEGLRGAARLLATKCDKCTSTNHEPACVSSCPHGCAVRVGSIDGFQKLLKTEGTDG